MDKAKSQLGDIRFVDVGLQRLVQKATAQTTRNAYARALQEKLVKLELRQ